MGPVISTILWLGTLLGAAVGTFLLIGGMFSAQSAPQQGAAAAMAAAAAILPYVAARAFDAVRRNLIAEAASVEAVVVPRPLELEQPTPKREVTAAQFAAAKKKTRLVWIVAGICALTAISLGIANSLLIDGSPTDVERALLLGNTGLVFGFFFFLAVLYGAFNSSRLARMTVRPQADPREK